jgi:two-component system phosphate regulon sensor histidine kinase PhoR
MKRTDNTVYRKNSSLIITLLLLVSVTLIVGLTVAYQYAAQNVENDFSLKKNSVVEQAINPYTDLTQNKILQINLFSGQLDSASAKNYVDTVFHSYSFVTKIVFYRLIVGNQGSNNTLTDHLVIEPKGIYQYYPPNAKIRHQKNDKEANITDFRQMSDKLNEYVSGYDTTRIGTPDVSPFYDTRSGKISFLNIPNSENLRIYHEIQKGRLNKLFYNPQNMMTFYVDIRSLKIKNIHPELYKDVSIQQLYYDPPDIDHTKILTDEVPLSGAFSDYKLYFSSPREYLTSEIYHRFLPVAGIILLIYSFFIAIGWLIYRNLSINMRLFKLQYDFINNFTHEFKTPVSVIKIAGSNLKGDNELTDRQRKHYGRILDEEADKLNELMNKLLSFTQLENKSIEIKKDKINIESFVKGYIETFKVKYPDFKLNYKIIGARFFYTDAILLGSVFQNLIENAYKYSHPQKKELFINITLEKRNIIFSFIDKGIGIPKNELNNIFKKFYRLENQYNQNGSVGLGLAFCKELVNFMDGEIVVRSKIDQGSEFILTFPYEN